MKIFSCFQELIKTILVNSGNSENKTNEFMLKKLKSFLSYNDIRYFALKYIKTDFFREQTKVRLILNITDCSFEEFNIPGFFYLSPQMNETILNNLISLFCLMPGLVKEAKPVKTATEKPQETVEAKEPTNGQPSKKQKTDDSFGQDKIDLVQDDEDNLDEILGLESGAKENGDANDLKLFALKIGKLTRQYPDYYETD